MRAQEFEIIWPTALIAVVTIIVVSLIGVKISSDQIPRINRDDNLVNNIFTLEVKPSVGAPTPLSDPLQSTSDSSNQKATGNLQNQNASSNLQKNAGSSTLDNFNL